MHMPMPRLTMILAVVAVAVTACGAPEAALTPASPTEPTAPPSTPPSAPPTTEPDLRYDQAVLRAELAQARHNWADFDTPSYRYRYQPVCFCEQIEMEAFVIDGKLVNDDGDPRRLSIEGWFDVIDHAIGTAFDVNVTYDDWGYPVSVYIDVDEYTADEEFGLAFGGYFQVPDAVDKFMTDGYGCGYGFAAAAPNQSVSFQAFFANEPAAGTYELADAEFAEVQFGADVMANWCDDVLEPDEPEPVVDERWTIVGGTVTITFDGPRATGELRDIVARTADGRDYPLGNTTVINDAWGMFAG